MWRLHQIIILWTSARIFGFLLFTFQTTYKQNLFFSCEVLIHLFCKMAGGSNTNNGKVKVRKVSLSVNSPARRKVSKTNKNSGLNALPPFQWSSANDQQTTLKNNDTMDQILMPPPIITRGLKSSGIRKLVAQYAQVSS